MRRKAIETRHEELIIIGMILSDFVLERIQPFWKPELLKLPYIRQVGGWCIEYWEKYKRAPGKEIQSIFYDEKIETMDEDQAILFEKILSTLSDRWGNAEINSPRTIDIAKDHFNKLIINKLIQDLEAAKANGDVELVEKITAEFKLLDESSQNSILLTDESEVESAYYGDTEPLFSIPGELGTLLNAQFTRESLIGIQGPEKVCKTWFMQYLGYRAYLQRRNVIMFQCGDLSENQQKLRLYTMMAKRSNNPIYCGDILKPVPDCALNQGGDCQKKKRVCDITLGNMGYEDAFDVGYEPCAVCRGTQDWEPAIWHEKHTVEPHTPQDIKKKLRRLKRVLPGVDFRLHCYSMDSMNVAGINGVLKGLQDEQKFLADVIIIDYADILASEPGSSFEFRHKNNSTWKAMRKLSQVWKACVIVATQANAKALKTGTVGRENFSEDKRKYAHVTAMIGLSKTEDEEEKGVLRVGKLVIREGKSEIKRKVTVLQSIQTGEPVLDSF